MIEKIQSNLVRILEDLYGDSHLNIDELKINLQENNDKKHGDLASNIALILASEVLVTNAMAISLLRAWLIRLATPGRSEIFSSAIMLSNISVF